MAHRVPAEHARDEAARAADLLQDDAVARVAVGQGEVGRGDEEEAEFDEDEDARVGDVSVRVVC